MSSVQQSNCPTITAPENGEIAGICSSAVTGDRCTFFCIGEYQVVGVSDLTCLDTGIWSGEIPTCELQQSYCPTLSAPENGEIAGNCSSSVTGDKCTFSCIGDYQLVGTSELICLDTGRWSSEIPACGSLVKTTCPDLSPPPNGLTNGSCSAAITGDTCMFSCETSFQLKGTKVVTCLEGGAWTDEIPVCEYKGNGCPPLSPPNQGEFAGACLSAVAGQRCSFSCVGDNQLLGPSTLICLESGNWSAAPPTCEQSICGSLRAPLNGMMSGFCSSAVRGDRCTFSCKKNYKLVGDSELTCLDSGKWSKESPTCELTGTSCEGLKPPANGQMYGYCSSGYPGDTCMFSCGAGFQVRGQKMLTCLESGVWSGDVPVCYKVSVQCPSLPAPANGKVLPCDTNVGSRCKITCSQGYTIFIGSSIRTCLSNGAWSGIETMCVTETSFLQWVPRAFG
ncbi:P-selectin-like isoform X1 [Tachypleus tridentatus]|uniref:P-selectin-like isoform X1 n=1 Tax=Tachypleus tridentatus TaxID=6853 RepID=UPI003FD57FD1